MNTFASEPATLIFSTTKDPHAELRLVDLLRRHERHTEKINITTPRDLLLDSEGRVQGRYSMTTTALKQICSRLVPGLAQTMSSIAGLQQNESEVGKDRVYSVPMAIRWMNDAIRLRFPSIEGCNLVVDHATASVEGLVGRMYAFVPNKDLYERAKEFLKDFDRPAEFREAVLAGRRMILRFQETEKLFSIPVPRMKANEPFFGGSHFANSEVGECSLRAAAVITRKWCDNRAISPFYEGGKIPHVAGQKFEKRFRQLLQQVQARSEETTQFKSSIIGLLDTNLELGISREHHDPRCARLVTKLCQRGMTSRFAKRVLHRTLQYGSYRSDKLDRSEQAYEIYATRTAYDLFNALTFEAKTRPPESRELAEQLAYQMLTGKFTLN